MSDASLWFLFVVNALAFVGLLALAVRGVRRAHAQPAEDAVIDLREQPAAVVPAPRVDLDELRMHQPRWATLD